MKKPIQKCWTFPSTSNPSKHYETLLYEDGSTSCNCPGWTRRVDPQGRRSCRHTRAVDMGTADMECVGTHGYNPTPVTPMDFPEEEKKKTPVVRKIKWR